MSSTPAISILTRFCTCRTITRNMVKELDTRIHSSWYLVLDLTRYQSCIVMFFLPRVHTFLEGIRGDNTDTLEYHQRLHDKIPRAFAQRQPPLFYLRWRRGDLQCTWDVDSSQLRETPSRSSKLSFHSFFFCCLFLRVVTSGLISRLRTRVGYVERATQSSLSIWIRPEGSFTKDGVMHQSIPSQLHWCYPKIRSISFARLDTTTFHFSTVLQSQNSKQSVIVTLRETWVGCLSPLCWVECWREENKGIFSVVGEVLALILRFPFRSRVPILHKQVFDSRGRKTSDLPWRSG